METTGFVIIALAVAGIVIGLEVRKIVKVNLAMDRWEEREKRKNGW